MAHTRDEQLNEFNRLLDVLDILRKECPWDKKQTNISLRPNTIEEVYELCDALLADDSSNICKELGDVLLHVCFYAKIGSERELFDIGDVCKMLTDKLIYRHPHIFGETTKGITEEQVLTNWEQLKLREKDGNKRVLSGVPISLPSLVKSFRIQEKAANVGFDWKEKNDVWSKLYEEIEEFRSELETENNVNAEIEFGDLLFSLVNIGRHYKINPDTALELANKKFISRFGYVEEKSIINGKPLNEMSLEEMDELWNQAKEIENV